MRPPAHSLDWQLDDHKAVVAVALADVWDKPPLSAILCVFRLFAKQGRNRMGAELALGEGVGWHSLLT